MQLPRIPGVPDLFRRIWVPKDIESVVTVGHEEDPAAAGMTQAGVDKIWRAAIAAYRTGLYPAVQVCVRREGVVVLDRAIGHADGNGPRDSQKSEKVLATPETPFLTYSASKGITAAVIHMLIDRGQLGLDDRISTYIPEYGCLGKESITIGQVLSHRAAVQQIPAGISPDHWHDREFIVDALCRIKAAGRPGTYQAYHALTGGLILGEVVHRVTGNDIRTLLAKEILQPLGFDWTNYGVAPESTDQVARNYVTGLPLLPPFTLLAQRALGASYREVTELGNDPRFLTAIVPSGNLVSTANELSRFYEIFRRGGEMDGVRVLSPETLRKALVVQGRFQPDLTLGVNFRFGYGFMQGGKAVSLFGPDTVRAFGHLGFINIAAWTDPQRALSAAIMTSGKPFLQYDTTRFYALILAIKGACPKVDPADIMF
jgi:CubicO group peptidase (beta-lactamase class C family)